MKASRGDTMFCSSSVGLSKAMKFVQGITEGCREPLASQPGGRYEPEGSGMGPESSSSHIYPTFFSSLLCPPIKQIQWEKQDSMLTS